MTDYDSWQNNEKKGPVIIDDRYPADMHGVWEIRGEDPNCDLGGHHGMPRLDIVEGRYDECLAYARTLPNWIQWGGGGKLEKLTIKKIDSDEFKELVAMRSRKKELEAEKETLQEDIDKLEASIEIQKESHLEPEQDSPKRKSFVPADIEAM